MTFNAIRLGRREGAQATVEVALLAPVFILILLGILEFSWWLNGCIAMTAAAREGARVATVAEQSDAVVAVNNDLSSTNVKNIAVSFAQDADEITVTVTGELEPLLGLFVRPPLNLTASAVMYVQ